MTAWRDRARRIKSECWASPWRVIRRDKLNRPLTFLQLSPAEMAGVAVAGKVYLPERVAARYGLLTQVAD